MVLLLVNAGPVGGAVLSETSRTCGKSAKLSKKTCNSTHELPPSVLVGGKGVKGQLLVGGNGLVQKRTILQRPNLYSLPELTS